MLAALVGNFDEEEALAMADEDWQQDSQGFATLDRDRFCRSWFQVHTDPANCLA